MSDLNLSATNEAPPVTTANLSQAEFSCELEVESSTASDPFAKLIKDENLRQFVKFCIVGGSSTVVTIVVLNLCHKILHVPLFTSLTAAFLMSATNGFLLNRKWTFKRARGNSAREQSLKFFAVSSVGYVLNISIVVLAVAHFVPHGPGFFGSSNDLQRVIMNVLTGDGKRTYPWLLINGAQGGAICIVVWWNYFANRLWTFKH